MPHHDHDVAIIGLGYVGLPTALAFHAAGARVLGIDLDEDRIARIRSGEVDLLDSDHARLRTALSGPPTAAPAEAGTGAGADFGLTQGAAAGFALAQGAAAGFGLTADATRSGEAAAVIVCVPTPVTPEHVPDLRALTRACRTAAENARPGQVLILTSTSYVGTTRDLLVGPLLERGLRPGHDVFVAFSPERIDPGNDRHAHEDVPRVVGGVTPECATEAAKVLRRYARNLHLVSSAEAAEMSKLLENTFRAVNIAMINEFAEASRALKLDVAEVVEAAATKPFGFMPFFPGPGAGGHCIPCDPHYLLWQLRKDRVPTPVVSAAMEGIAMRPLRVVERAREVLSDHGLPLRGARVLVLGVAYKPGVADLRESPALAILDGLAAAGAQVAYHDPDLPVLTLADGTTLTSSDPGSADLVIAHSPPPGASLSWLAEDQLVLDTTYRLTGTSRRVAL